MTLRKLTASDREFILRLSAEAFGEYTPEAAPRTVDLAYASGHVTWVAVDASRALGFATVELKGAGAYLVAIAVAREHRGIGFGQRLLAAVERQCRAAGARRIALTTAESNLAALQLFLRAGYAIEQRRARYYARGQTGLHLSKQL